MIDKDSMQGKKERAKIGEQMSESGGKVLMTKKNPFLINFLKINVSRYDENTGKNPKQNRKKNAPKKPINK